MWLIEYIRYCLKKVCKPLFSCLCIWKQLNKETMELAHSQVSEILSNYTSSSEGFVTLQSLIMNSLMRKEWDLFVNENKHEQCNGFRSRRWYSHGFEFSLRIPRSRSGNFYQVLSGLIRSEGEERARLVQSSLHQRSYRRADRWNIWGYLWTRL